jgi:hypothetical protein
VIGPNPGAAATPAGVRRVATLTEGQPFVLNFCPGWSCDSGNPRRRLAERRTDSQGRMDHRAETVERDGERKVNRTVVGLIRRSAP